MIKLILKFQDTVVQEYSFDTSPIRIGRRDDNNIIIDNMAVSGHHSQIDFQPPNFVITDKESLNGTFVNEKKVSQENLYDGDEIIIGKHSLIFQDLRPESERPMRPDLQPAEVTVPEFRETVLLDTKAQQELLAKQEAGIVSEQGDLPKPKKIIFHGSVTILAGGTPQIIELNKNLTKLGSGEEVDIKCTGFLVGKIAAIINRRPNGFYLAYSEGLKKPEVNREPVTTQKQLKDGDEIKIGSTRMTFNLKEEIINPD